MTWKFKEKNTGGIVEFFTEYDAKVMRDHPEYEEIVETQDAPKQGKVKKDSE